MVLSNTIKVEDEICWGAQVEETKWLNFLCWYLLEILKEKGFLEKKTNELPSGMVISREKFKEGIPTFITFCFKGQEFLFLEFGHKPKNVLGPASEINCSPCVAIACGKYIWFEPNPPKILSYTGENWLQDAPKFRSWVIESGNPGFNHGHMFAPENDLINTIGIIEKAVLRYVN